MQPALYRAQRAGGGPRAAEHTATEPGPDDAEDSAAGPRRMPPITLLTAAGVASRAVMEALEHSQIGITMDVYTHVVQDTQREAISHMDRLLTRRPVVSDRPR